MEERFKMKTKNSITGMLVLAMLLLSVSMVAGAITQTTPSTAGTTVTGDYTFNVTTALGEALNCTWATTADGVFAITANSSASQTVFANASFDSTALTDAEDTTLTILCSNASTTETATLLINVDNTDPVCSFSVDVDSTEALSASGVQTTQASTDTTDLTYSWVLYDTNGLSKTTTSLASPSFSVNDFDTIGDFKIGLTVTDEAGKTNACTNQTIMVSGSDDGSTNLAVGTTTTTTGGDTTIIIVIIVVLVIIILAVGLYFVIDASKGKKKRRK